MLRVARRVESVVSCRAISNLLAARWSRSVASAARQHDPLKILFCGADEFSIYSLRALRELQHREPDTVESIDVVCRPDKRVGRGLKQIQEVPIKSVALHHGLRLYQIDTFRDWSLPTSINLVIAVSFGLLVPARVLNAATYGGLNVHPSLLPDLRGPAPMIHTLLKRREYTGVTLQTMHPTRFDHGDILAQTPMPGTPVPNESTPDELLRILGPLGAEMLCRSIEAGLFVPPVRSIQKEVSDAVQFDDAPKISSEDRRIDWHTWRADEIQLRDRVLGRLWDTQTYGRCHRFQQAKRTTFHGPWRILSSVAADYETPGQPFLALNDTQADQTLAFKTVDGKLISPATATLDGERAGMGLAALSRGINVDKPSN